MSASTQYVYPQTAPDVRPVQYAPVQVIPQRRRRWRWWRVLLALVLGLIAVDRVAEYKVENGFEQALNSTPPPAQVTGAKVSILGFPFLPQLVRQRLGNVVITLDEASFDGFQVKDVILEAHDVQPTQPWEAGLVDVNAVITYDTIETLLAQQFQTEIGLSAATETPGALHAELSASVLGISVPIDLVIMPTLVANNTLNIDVGQVGLGGAAFDSNNLPGGIGTALDEMQIPLPLPAGVNLQDIRVDDTGIWVHGIAENINLESFTL